MAANISPSAAVLDGFVGKSIEDICPLKFGKIGDSENHCAHFVSHVLKLNSTIGIGVTCASMTFDGGKHRTAGACIRVNEIFNVCDDLANPDEKGCLVYFTLPGNMKSDGMMGDMRQKHVGIYLDGMIWNYGNKADKVRKDKLSFLEHLYGATTITRYTVFPDGADFLTIEQIKALAK